MRILTLNLFARHGAWEERRPMVRDGLRSLRPDLVAFQEAVRTEQYDQVVDLLGSDFHLVDHPGRSADGVGATLASRWPVVEARQVGLRVSDRVTLPWCGTVAAEIATPDAGPLLFVHHKPSWQLGLERERELEALAATRLIEEIVGERDLHVVVAGDLDAEPHAASIRFWSGRRSLDGTSVCYDDAWERVHAGASPESGHTFSPRNPLVRTGTMPLEQGRRIDYILVRCGDHGPTLEVASCERVFDRAADGIWASDHFGVVADLRPLPHLDVVG